MNTKVRQRVDSVTWPDPSELTDSVKVKASRMSDFLLSVQSLATQCSHTNFKLLISEIRGRKAFSHAVMLQKPAMRFKVIIMQN